MRKAQLGRRNKKRPGKIRSQKKRKYKKHQLQIHGQNFSTLVLLFVSS